MKKILVTGSRGFIGTELLNLLKDHSEFEIVGFTSSMGDISLPGCLNVLNDFKFDHVIHLAGKTFVPDSWEDPVSFAQVNAIGTQNVLEFCRKKNLPLTYISAYVYGAPESLPIKEEHTAKPNNPYALSKFMGEELCRFYSACFSLKTCILRPFNVYGAAQPDHFLIPIIFEQALSPEKKKVTVKVLEPKRDYVHVKDVCGAIFRTIKYLENKAPGTSNTFNIGSGRSFSVKEVVESVLEVVGIEKEIFAENKKRQNEVLDTIADIQKTSEELGWKPQIELIEGLKLIYLSNYLSEK